MNTSTTTASATSAPATVWLARGAAVLAALAILWQGFSASNVIVSGDAALGPHAAGAIVVHVLTGLLVAATALHWWTSRRALWPVVLSAVVFAATFVEATLGHKRTLWVHVPLALLITIGVATVLAWSFSRFAPARPSRH